LQQAQGEAANMRDLYPDTLADTRSKGIGLDFAVLCEKLAAAQKLLELLA